MKPGLTKTFCDNAKVKFIQVWKNWTKIQKLSKKESDKRGKTHIGKRFVVQSLYSTITVIKPDIVRAGLFYVGSVK